MGLKTEGPVSVHTPHCTHVKSHLALPKSLWLVMMDDNAPTHERRKLVKTYKNVLPQKLTVVAEVFGETYSKNDKKHTKKWSRKTVTNIKY